jgi:hypothetical protein
MQAYFLVILGIFTIITAHGVPRSVTGMLEVPCVPRRIGGAIEFSKRRTEEVQDYAQ